MIVGLITTPIITRMVDPVENGQLSIFTMYSTLAAMILCLGLDQALVRFYYEQDGIEYKRQLLFRCIRLPIIISLGLSIIIVFLSASNLVSFEFSTPIMVLLCVCSIIQLVYRFSLLLVRLAYKSKRYSTLNVLHKVIYLATAVGLLYYVKNHDLLVLIIATLTSFALCMILSIVMQPQEWKFFSRRSDQYMVPDKELIKYSLPFILSMSVTQLFHAIDKMSLNHYCTYSDVGVYASTMNLVHIFAIIQTSFNTVWAPMQVEHYTKEPEDHSFYQKGHQIITVVMFFMGLSLIFFKDIFAFILGSKYREAAYILPFLIFNPIMYTISETTCGGLIFMKKSKMQVVVALGACVTNIIGNTLLVPTYGCKGAAISTGLSYIVFFTLRTIIANKYFYTDFKLYKLYFITILTSIFAYYNTFFTFDWVVVVGYIISIIILFILYKDAILWGGEYLKNLLHKRKT